MCGIVGYIGKKPAVHAIVSGLKKLEYRGYDSAGVALMSPGDGKLMLYRSVGKISALESVVASEPPPRSATTGIGHTRWATHGAPTVENAHPHVSMDGTIAVVHNGIIENHAALRKRLEAGGFVFKSQTDTEVLAHLIQEFRRDCDNLTEAVSRALSHVEGTYGIAVVSTEFPDTIVAARKGSPIALGSGAGATIVASDISAIIQHTNSVIFLDDEDIATITRDSVDVRSIGNTPVFRDTTVIDWDLGSIEKGGYAHFMLKEIFEQPDAVANTIRGRLVPSDGVTKLSGFHFDPKEIASLSNICIAACGTSYYAGLVGACAIEQFADIPTRVEQAAEFRYRNPLIPPNTAVIAISQSGETADTLAAVREAKRKGATALSICNVVGSTIARETGRGVYLHAGPEIGVASTKAFTCQVAVLAMTAILLGRTRRLSHHAGLELVEQIANLPKLVAAVLEKNDEIKKIAERHCDARDFFYIGRGYMYPAALEGALKLKEISYLHAEGYHAAELKHGPIALLDSNVPVVACVPMISGHHKTLGNMQECRARQSPVIAIATEGDPDVSGVATDIISIPPCAEFLSPIPVVVAQQLFAYHVANLRGEAIDQPRNLAKSVTVE